MIKHATVINYVHEQILDPVGKWNMKVAKRIKVYHRPRFMLIYKEVVLFVGVTAVRNIIVVCKSCFDGNQKG